MSKEITIKLTFDKTWDSYAEENISDDFYVMGAIGDLAPGVVWQIQSDDPYKELRKMGIDPLVVKNKIGQEVVLLLEDTPRKIENAFWSTPCGYWTECYKLEGRSSPVMRSQIKEFK
jgi:hypothetical protein